LSVKIESDSTFYVATTLQSPRERILTEASRLFYTQGVNATGINQIIEQADVAKMTLYYHFPSKAALVAAYLERRHEHWMVDFKRHPDAVKTSGLAAFAEALGRWFTTDDFRGCAFINACAEDAGEPARKIGMAHKRDLQNLVETRLRKNGFTLRAAEKLAAQAILVIEGMIVRFHMTGDKTVVADGADLLRTLERASVRSR
jgi:AcrR family transcriptional regulator